MLRNPAPTVHALLRVSDPDALLWEQPPPDWARASLQRAPWVVVRRSAMRPGAWPVGVRGALRSQRLAAWVPDRAVRDCVTPQSLAARRFWRRHPRRHASPAIQVLDQVSAVLAAHGHAGRWGPGGSVGFELASAVPCTTLASDLDLVLRLDHPIARGEAGRLHAELSKLPVRIDVLLETPHGAVALAEFILASGLTLLRSADGARLVRNPWAADRAAASIP
jgi:phosphoribosyl-dephospho-CoA transferase